MDADDPYDWLYEQVKAAAEAGLSREEALQAVHDALADVAAES